MGVYERIDQRDGGQEPTAAVRNAAETPTKQGTIQTQPVRHGADETQQALR